MTERIPPGRLGDVAQKWRSLAEQRRVYYADMHESGRWKKYWAEEDLLLRMREVEQSAARWAAIAPAPESGQETLRPRPPRRLALPPANTETPPERPAAAPRRPAA